MPVAALARFQMRDAGFDHERDRNGRDTSDEVTSH